MSGNLRNALLTSNGIETTEYTPDQVAAKLALIPHDQWADIEVSDAARDAGITVYDMWRVKKRMERDAGPWQSDGSTEE